MCKRCDVCVFGLGAAGAATAARLADLGVAVVVLERPPARKPWGGESFTGTIREPLTVLGVWERFCAAGHVAGYERRSAWGEAGTTDSIFNPYGNAWHVDRDRFDADLRAAVAERGIPFRRYASLDSLQRDGGWWHVALAGRSTIAARSPADWACGRASMIAWSRSPRSCRAIPRSIMRW